MVQWDYVDVVTITTDIDSLLRIPIQTQRMEVLPQATDGEKRR